MTEKITITVPIPRPKKRIGVMPTRREKDRSKEIPRKDKHRRPPATDDLPV